MDSKENSRQKPKRFRALTRDDRYGRLSRQLILIKALGTGRIRNFSALSEFANFKFHTCNTIFILDRNIFALYPNETKQMWNLKVNNGKRQDYKIEFFLCTTKINK